MAFRAISPANEKKYASEENDSRPFDHLIRQLVGTLAGGIRTGPGQERQPGEEEIVLDTYVDGTRYLIIRMPAEVLPSTSLSPREREVVGMVAKGYSNKIIADILGISSWTVCTHLRRIFAKLGVTSRAAMVSQLQKERRIWGHMHQN